MATKTESIAAGGFRGFFSSPAPYVLAAGLLLYIYKDKIFNALSGGLSGAGQALGSAGTVIQNTFGDVLSGLSSAFGGNTNQTPMQDPKTTAYLMMFQKQLEDLAAYQKANPNMIQDPNVFMTMTNAGNPILNFDALFKFNPKGIVGYGSQQFGMGKGLSFLDAFNQGLIPKEEFLKRGIDIDSLLKMNLGVDLNKQMQNLGLSSGNGNVPQTVNQIGGSLMSQLGQMFHQFGSGVGAGLFTVRDTRPLSTIIAQNQGISASKAADLLAMMNPDPQYASFNFGTNTGAAKTILEQYAKYRGMA